MAHVRVVALLVLDLVLDYVKMAVIQLVPVVLGLVVVAV